MLKAKETKWYLKITEVLLYADGHEMRLPKFDIYQGTGAKNCFKSHTNSFFLTHKYHTKINTSIT